MLLVSSRRPNNHAPKGTKFHFRTVKVDLSWLQQLVRTSVPWDYPLVSYRGSILEIHTDETLIDIEDLVLLAFEMNVEVKNFTVELDEESQSLIVNIHRPMIPWRPIGKPTKT